MRIAIKTGDPLNDQGVLEQSKLYSGIYSYPDAKLATAIKPPETTGSK